MTRDFPIPGALRSIGIFCSGRMLADWCNTPSVRSIQRVELTNGSLRA
jgi:hypothetical protein